MADGEARKIEILLVDNDSRILELVAWFLEKRGFGVRTALSFREARAELDTAPPDLLLSDIDLGEEDAREELPRLAARGALPPTLVVSGYLDAEIVAELEALPEVIGTLAKPYDFAVLEERVRACCAQLVRGEPAAARDVATVALEDPGADEPEEDDEGWIEIVPRAPLPRSRPEQLPQPEAGPGPAPFRLS